jgi:tRNA-dihydrouridine synthase B
MDEIHFAPLQGFTDLAYCNAHFQFVGNVDFYYTPYFSVDDVLFIDQKTFREGLFVRTIPQILPGSLDELKVLLQFIIDNGFSSININLGCPYPMVTRKGRGAGLLENPELVSKMARYICENSSLSVSLKTRLGLNDETSIFKLLEKISSEKIETVIIHPRTAKQLYKGNASPAIFMKCKELFPQIDLIYNGDISLIEDVLKLKDQIEGQDKWMLGRGLLSNPLLGWQIKNNCVNLPNGFYEKIYDFVFDLIDCIETDSKDQGHALNRVKSQFIYLSNSFPENQKIYRTIRKSKSLVEVKEFLIRKSYEMRRQEH